VYTLSAILGFLFVALAIFFIRKRYREAAVSKHNQAWSETDEIGISVVNNPMQQQQQVNRRA